ncbi:MAG: hypothetical protein KC433_15440 [Anaerolineales bacterium]|nr:hypothetical protein [Anaerolineales bacterium]MCB8939864.1 hypothetical protein [Ardenticatenaceae bacterium]
MRTNDFRHKKIGLGMYVQNEDILEQKTFPRKQTILTLQNCLRAFSDKLFDYFYDHISADKLEESADFPFEYALDTVLDQISNDIGLIQKAIHQRQDASNQGILNLADFLAYKALKPMLPPVVTGAELQLRSDTTVLTYFQKTVSVRIIPYAPVVLVGIPYSCLNDKKDLLAIPHEIGHYIYRHALFNGENIADFLRADDSFPAWIQNWFEEIFADVYGALIAGPVLGLSFQDLQLNMRTESFYTDDGEHPVPLLRPYIYMNVIEHAPSIGSWAGKLRANWTQYLLDKRDDKMALKNPKLMHKEILPGVFDNTVERKIQLKGYSELYKVEDFISIENPPVNGEAVKPLDKIIGKIQYKLLKHISNGSWTPAIAPGEATVDNLYTEFQNYVETQVADPVPELSISGQDRIVVGKKPTHLKVGELVRATDELIQGPDVLPPEGQVVSKQKWLRKLDARGWATRGPDCDGTGGVNC